jgi:hypothetical protein
MTLGARKAAILFAALSLALFAAGSWRVEAAKAAHARSPKLLRHAEVSAPFPLCTALKGRQWRRWAHAQQADGGRWIHACSYDRGTYL